MVATWRLQKGHFVKRWVEPWGKQWPKEASWSMGVETELGRQEPYTVLQQHWAQC